MKTLFVLFGMFAASAAANAAIEGAYSLKATAWNHLQPTLGEKWKDAKVSERCGSTKVAGQRYKYSCVFQLEGEHSGGAFAVFFDDSMQLVAIVRGEGKRVGKKMQYAFGLKEAIGFTEIKPEIREGKEVNQ